MKKSAEYPFWLRVIVVLSLIFFAVNVLFFLGPVVALLIGIRDFGAKEIITGIGGLAGTLFATFIGAWLAFHFARRRREDDKIANEVAAGNRALFTLTIMFNQTFQHQEEIVHDYRERDDAWINLPVAAPLEANLSFDMKELSFLLQKEPTVFQQVLLEEARFKLLAFYIADHRSFNLTVVRPRLEANGVTKDQPRHVDEIKSILGGGTANRLTETARGIIQNCDDNVASLKAAFVALRIALKKFYPDKPFINFEFKEPKKSGKP